MTDNEHQDIEEKHAKTMKELGILLDLALNPAGIQRFCFCLLITEFGDNPEARMNYISNATREDMLAALKEFIGKAEADEMPSNKDVIN